MLTTKNLQQGVESSIFIIMLQKKQQRKQKTIEHSIQTWNTALKTKVSHPKHKTKSTTQLRYLLAGPGRTGTSCAACRCTWSTHLETRATPSEWRWTWQTKSEEQPWLSGQGRTRVRVPLSPIWAICGVRKAIRPTFLPSIRKVPLYTWALGKCDEPSQRRSSRH